MGNDFLSGVTDMEKLRKLLDRRESGMVRHIDSAAMADAIKQRVRGQDHVVDAVSEMVKLQWAKIERKKPIASILFVGPPGVGKSEMAKAMAEYLFGDEKTCLTFSGPDFTGPEGKNRLIGVADMYKGAEAGGQLTRPMMSNPRRLIIFDEIEKAWPEIFDLFLSVMGDGYLKEGNGKSADFTQSIIILTSNAEQEAVSRIDKEVADPYEKINAIKSHLADCKVFRPEQLSRFDLVCVFHPLDGIVNAEIAVQKARSVAKAYGLEMTYIEAEIVIDIMTKSEKLKRFGARQVEKVIDSMLAAGFVEARDRGETKVRVVQAPNGDVRVVAEPPSDRPPLPAGRIG